MTATGSNSSRDYDVIVIGSGLAGLTGANRLALAGHKVLIVEQHFQLGGLATWFRRPGRELFDISLHGFPIGMKKTCRKYWSKEIADRVEQLHRIRFDNPQFKLETTFDRVDFTRLLRDHFGIPEAQVVAFFDRARDMNFFDEQTQTVGELFEEFFPGRHDVWRLLMEPIAYANGSTLDDPAITYGIVFSNFMSKGVYTFRGGTDELIKEMRKVLRENGVDVRRNTVADKVIFDRGRVVGVQLTEMKERTPKERTRERTEVVNCRAVLSNANIVSTVADLAGEAAPPDFLGEARAVRLNSASSQVYIGIKEGEQIENLGDLFFTSKAPEFDSDALCAKETSSWTFSFYYPELRPKHNRYAIVASINSRWQDWANLSAEQYDADKQKLIDDTIVWLERWLPDVRGKISHIEASTPTTFNYYTMVRMGTSFGTKFEGLAVSQKLPDVCPGLYHAGSVGIIMSGWLGAANYGVIVAAKIDEYLHKLKRDGAVQVAT